MTSEGNNYKGCWCPSIQFMNLSVLKLISQIGIPILKSLIFAELVFVLFDLLPKKKSRCFSFGLVISSFNCNFSSVYYLNEQELFLCYSIYSIISYEQEK